MYHTHTTCKMSTFSCTDDESNNNNDEDFLTLYVDYMSQPSRACAMFVRYEFRGVRLISFLFTPYARAMNCTRISLSSCNSRNVTLYV